MSIIICSCGNKIEYKEEPVLCEVCGNKNFFCPECRAPLSIPKNAVAVSCPYCNASLVAEDLSQEKLFFPVSYDESTGFSKFQWFLLNRFGIPDDMKVEFTPKNIKLHYIPLYIYDIKSSLTPEIIEKDTRGIIATDKVWFKEFIKDYRFPVKGKIYYKAEEIEGEIYDAELPEEVIKKRAYEIGREMSYEDARRFNISGSPEIEIKKEGMIYYPFYEIVYRYKGGTYRGVIDATNGVICYAEYPLSRGARTWLRIAGGLYALLSVLVGIVEGAVFYDLIPSIIVITQGIIIGAVIFFEAGKVKRGKEEIKTTEKKLIIESLDKKINL